MRRSLFSLTISLFALLWLTASLYSRVDNGQYLLRPPLPFPNYGQDRKVSRPVGPIVPVRSGQIKDGTILSAGNITLYLDTIFGRTQGNLPSLQCPSFGKKRYKALQATGAAGFQVRWFFALNLRNCIELLPRLIGSVIEVMRFLGPQHCALSIVEGLSTDGTADVLIAITDELQRMGVRYFFHSSTVDPSADDRITRLAELRNMALHPLLFNPTSASEDMAVIFLNDVAACPDDILELIYQRRNLGADMVCGMDWNSPDSGDSLFYDVWISRDINGESFFRIGDMGEWDRAQYLFWDSPLSKARFEAKRPFQVFACWNGGAVISARPFIEQNIRFRVSNDRLGECFMGEPQLLCKDMWFQGYGKIAVVPSVNFEYSIKGGNKIKKEKGFVTEIVGNQDPAGDDFSPWLGPPDYVRCMAGFESQSMVLWNESLTRD